MLCPDKSVFSFRGARKGRRGIPSGLAFFQNRLNKTHRLNKQPQGQRLKTTFKAILMESLQLTSPVIQNSVLQQINHDMTRSPHSLSFVGIFSLTLTVMFLN